MTGPPPSTDREALILALAEQARSGVLKEPEPEELLDYLEGRLAPEEARRIERLLVAYPDTARALLDLAAERSDVLAELEAAGAKAGERPAEIATVAGWRDFQARLPEVDPRPRPLELPAPLPRPRHPTWLSAIAASLLVATVGLGLWVWWLHSALHRPIADLASLALLSGSRTDTAPVVKVPPGEPLHLLLAPAARCSDYAIEVEGPRSGDRQTIEGLKRDQLGRLNPQLWLEPGSYRLRLLGCEPRRELEEHRFRIIRSNAG